MVDVIQWQNMRLWLAQREFDSPLPPSNEVKGWQSVSVSALERRSEKRRTKREKKMKILFICKYNRFRSQVAERYFRKINKNKSIKSYSAGVIKGTFIAKSVKDIGKKLGINLSGKPKGINEKLLKDVDLLVITANDVPKQLFEKKTRKVIKWNIPDTSQDDLCNIERISRMIMKKVDKLNETLEKNDTRQRI